MTDPGYVVAPSTPPGNEFLEGETPILGLPGRTVADFWQWAYSDILSSRNRSVFAEFIVGSALGVLDEPRVEWDAADLKYRGLRIEVKSSAECQSWHQHKASDVRFSIRKAIVWDPATGQSEGAPVRCADIYVFCHYPERDRSKANVLDVPAWDFYVVRTKTLNQQHAEAKSLSLAAVRRIATGCKWSHLKSAIDQIPAILNADTA